MGRTNPASRLLRALLPPAFWLGAWQLCAWLVELHVEGRGNELLLPYPATVALALAGLAGQPAFWAAVAASLLRILVGLAAGVLLGAGLAALTCASPWCSRLLAPAVRVIRATPVASFILLVLLWTGRGTVPAVISALMVLPVVWENLSRGIRAANQQLLELARENKNNYSLKINRMFEASVYKNRRKELGPSSLPGVRRWLPSGGRSRSRRR